MTEDIVEYQCVCGETAGDLNIEVNQLISRSDIRDNQSWNPHGSVFVTPSSSNVMTTEYRFFQAMVLVEYNDG